MQSKRALIKRRGLIITDAVIGLAVLATLLAITAITVGHDKRATRAAEAHRLLTFEAESAMTALRVGQPLPEPANPVITVRFNLIDTGAAPDEQAWLSVTASDGKQSSEILGMVPKIFLPAEQEEGASE